MLYIMFSIQLRHFSTSFFTAISPGLIFVQEGFFSVAIFSGGFIILLFCFLEGRGVGGGGLLLKGVLHFKNGSVFIWNRFCVRE